MNKIALFKTDGTVEKIEQEKQPTLEQVQEWVGGYVERVNIPELEAVEEMYVNEEGLLEGLPLNSQASILAGQPIVGDAVIFQNFSWI